MLQKFFTNVSKLVVVKSDYASFVKNMVYFLGLAQQ